MEEDKVKYPHTYAHKPATGTTGEVKQKRRLEQQQAQQWQQWQQQQWQPHYLPAQLMPGQYYAQQDQRMMLPQQQQQLHQLQQQQQQHFLQQAERRADDREHAEREKRKAADDRERDAERKKRKAEAINALPSEEVHGSSPFGIFRETPESCKKAKDYFTNYPPCSLKLGTVSIRSPEDLMAVPGFVPGTLVPSTTLEPHWNGVLPSPKQTCYFAKT